MTEKVIFQAHELGRGLQLAQATLNKPKALNALDLDMIRALQSQLTAWQADDNIVAVLLDAEGDKAFCAGGDIVAMYNAMQAEQNRVPELVEMFFTEEYRVDHLIRTYSKPIIAWGHGIVMGGGLGLMSGASHRVVTETSRIAMPEISIGLYPDVCASWFLHRMPGNTGLFLGLTGANINATDALYVNLADHFVPNEQKMAFISACQQQDWSGESAKSQLDTLLQQLGEGAELPVGQIERHQQTIDGVTAGENIAVICEQIKALDAGDDKWLSRAQQTLAAGSPLTAAIVQRQLQESQNLSASECYRLEAGISCRCGEYGEFQEGVRALLIDKDNQPNWRFKSVSDVPAEVLDWFFTSPWVGAEHPLADLSE